MEVENFTNNNGNQVPNQFIINGNMRTTFQSYDSEICYLEYEKLFLNGNMWDYSNTTRKYFKQFINEETPFNYIDKQQFLKEIEENDLIEVI